MSFHKQIGDYDNFATAQRDAIQSFLPYIDHSLEGKDVLELGSGTGLLTQELLKRNPKSLLATDISESMLNLGKENVPTATWQKMDAWNPQAQKKYDRLYASNLLQWAPEPKKVLTNWRNLLKPFGKLHCVFFIDKTLHELSSLLPERIKPITWHTRKYWEKAFKKNNFTLTDAQDYLKTYTFPSTLDLLRQLHKTGVTQKNQLTYTEMKYLIMNYEKAFSQGSSILSTWHSYRIHCTVRL